MIKKYYAKNLHCGGCASKIQYEFDKKENYHSAINGYLVRSAEGLAVAMWRYKNLGTIFT